MATYATLDQVKATISLPTANNDPAYADDTPLTQTLTQALEAAETLIETWCGQTWTADTVPPPIRQATIILAGDIFQRTKQPLGIIETADVVMYSPRQNHTVNMLIQPYLSPPIT